MKVIDKAGTLPYRRGQLGQVEILTIGRQNRSHWILPMGKIDPGETAQQAARRETQEEAGIDVRVGPHLGDLCWIDKLENTHRVAFYLAEYQTDTEWPESDKRRRMWISLEEAEGTLAEDFRGFAREAKKRLHPVDNLLLRQATPEDSEFAYQVKKAAFRDYVLKVWDWNEARQRQYHERRFAAQDFRVIQISGTDVGILATQNTPECLKLNQIFILPYHQNKGIGSACMNRLIEESQTEHLPIYLQVLKVNPRAIAFYTRFGFKPIGETLTHIQMERPVE